MRNALFFVTMIGATSSCARSPVTSKDDNPRLELTVTERDGRHYLDVRLVNPAESALVLRGWDALEGEPLPKWLKRKLDFETNPPVAPTHYQTAGRPRPPAVYRVAPGGSVDLAWETDDELLTAPGYPVRWSSPGLFRIRARLHVDIIGGQILAIASRWQGFSVGGSTRPPKAGVGTIIAVDAAAHVAVIGRGKDDQIAVGDRFLASSGKAYSWDLEVLETWARESRCAYRLGHVTPGFTDAPGPPRIGAQVELVSGLAASPP